MKKTWTQKFHVNLSPMVKVCTKAFGGIPEGATMLIPNPPILDAYVRTIPKGRTVPMQVLRKDMALEHGAEYSCPITTGIFLRILAEAAYEQYQQNPDSDIAPFWRVVSLSSPTAKKLTFGTDFLKQRRVEEGMEG